MALKDLPTTVGWIYMETVLWSFLCISVSILVFIELSVIWNEYKLSEESKLSGIQLGSTNQTTPDLESSSSRSNTSSKSNKSKPKIQAKLAVLTILMYLSYIGSGITAILYKFGIGIFSGCNPCGIQGIFYTSGKMILYLLWFYRLYMIYSKSIFKYKTGILIILAVISVLFNCMISVINLFTVTSVSIDVSGYMYCQCIVSLKQLVALVLLFDFIISILCCYLFIRPIKKMNFLEKETRDEYMYGVVLRFTTLTFVAVISTMLFMVIIIITKLNGLMSIDATINCFTIFFFNAQYKSYYQKVCCGATKCAEKIVSKCCVKKE